MNVQCVAVREVVDLVYRASRVSGCDSSSADRVADEVTFCEVRYGGGLAAWVALVDHAPERIPEVVQSSYKIDIASARARSEGVGQVDWEPCIPFAFLARSIRSFERQGFKISGIPSSPTGTDPISNVELLLMESPEAEAGSFDEKIRAALVSGLRVEEVLWFRLQQEAAEFLTSEVALDSVLSSDDVGAPSSLPTWSR